MADTINAGELTALLTTRRDACELLLSLSRGQENVFAAGGAKGLMKVVAHKHCVLTDIAALDGKLARYGRDWDATIEALPAQARPAVSGLVAEMASLVDGLRESEGGIVKTVASARDEKAQEMKAASAGLVAARAYGCVPADGAGRILDREE